MTGMGEVYANLDKFFRQVKMQEVTCPGRRNDSANHADRNIFLELLDCFTVPFDLRQTEQAIWALKTTPLGESNAIFAEYITADENTRLKSACLTTTRHGRAMSVVVHVAIRKYVEQDRTVLITRKLVQPIQDLFAVCFKETARLLLKRGKPSATGPTTVLQTHCRATDHEAPSHGKAQRGHSSWRTTPYYEGGARA
ncbi:uncharacterized protein IUM83_11058 [Phytophthora cinnamomi]|uniref:uncharacterized protein n=1 Tax=Phytophthora cinnamomi TaxID=4785 RepID=UPI0035597C33|nr:hypothetical protein IUM83_11058 [Phytophthora cinnamomi]